MGQKKSKKILVITILLMIILIVLIGVTYAYLATDTFKSNKELFFKYIAQVGENETLETYWEKKKNTPNTNEGTLKLNVMSGNQMARQYETVNNFNISFSGQTDKANDAMEQDISLNYSEEESFPISYRKIENTMGVQTRICGKQIHCN